MASCSLLDLPRPFLTQLLQELDFSSVHALLTTSQQAFSLVWELKPGALCLWGPEARYPLKQMLHLLRNLGALLLPDCGDKCRLPRYGTLHMPSLRTAVLHYTFPYCMRLDAAAHPNKIESIIVRGWDLDPIFNLRLSMFLEQLQRLDGLQHLVLALPCGGVSVMLLGRLTRLRSLRMCADVSHSSEKLLRQDFDLTWKSGCWQSGIAPLTQLTSLQLQVPLVLGLGDDLRLEALSGLRRLELLLDRPVVSDGNSMSEIFGEAAGGAQAANVFLQQPGLPSLQHLTRLVLATTYHRSFFMFDSEAGGLRSPPDDTMETLAHLTALVSLHITPHEWSFSLQQLQPLSACTRLTELGLAQLALGFVNDPPRIDRNGTQLSREEKAVVQAATAAAAALHKQQQGAAVPAGPSLVCVGTASASSSVRPEQMQGVQNSPVARAAAAAAAARGPSSPAAAGVAADTRSGAADGSSGSSGSSSSKTVAVNGRQVQVPLLPQLVVLRVGSLWWRLPLVVLSPRLEDVTYKRLSGTDGGAFVMTDLQNMAEFDGPGGDVFANLADLGAVPPLQAEAAAQAMGQLLFGAQQGWQGPPALQGAAPQLQQQQQGWQGPLALQGAAAAALPDPDPQLEQQQQLLLQGPGGLLQVLQQHHQLQQQQQQQQQQQLQLQQLQQEGVEVDADMVAEWVEQAVAQDELQHQQLVQQLLQQLEGQVVAAEQADLQPQQQQQQNELVAQPIQDAQHHGEHLQGVQQHLGDLQALAHQMALPWPGQQAAAGGGAGAAAAADPQAVAVDGLDGSADSEAGVGLPQLPPLLDVHQGPEVLPLVQDMQGVQQQQQHQQAPAVLLGQMDNQAAAAAAVAAATGEDSAAEAAIAAAGVLPAGPLSDAPADQVYADVLRGLRGLRKLDVDVTGLCKVVKLSSLPLAGVVELRLHMLGAVHLPQGGLPRLPSLTHLEFYLPAERSWEADYNDYEDLPLWQHQSNVRQLIIRGTYHAGGFFAPGHLQLASACMPHITRLVLRQCQDLRPEHLQKVVDSKVSRYIEVVEGSNFGAVGGGAAGGGGGGGEGVCATAWPEGVDETTPSSSVSGYGLEDMSMDGDAEADGEEDGEEEGEEDDGGREEGGVSTGDGGGEGEELQEEEGGAGVASPPGLLGMGSVDSEEEDGGAAEGEGSSGWQSDPVAAAKAAQGARQAGMRDVAAAAAGVGVFVRLLPVNRWQDWYKEMLE